MIFTPFESFNAASNFPEPTNLKYVNDYTNTLDSSTKEYIVSVGKELEDKTGAQETIVIIDSLKGQDVETYANELFREWKIGKKDKNNGLLVLLSIKDKKWRVEVGKGLEGAVPDILTSRVMTGIARPLFKEGNYNEGLKKSYSAFADAIAKEYNVTLEKNEKVTLPKSSKSTSTNPIKKVIIAIVVIFILLDIFLNKGRILGLFFGGRGGFGSHTYYGGGGFGGNDHDDHDDFGGFGGFGGGDSGGGGSSGDW
jgi:uncharacterized protein